ncbi:hypothetical protein WA026_015778 [Henosepilachna vigintioctopunctata]|uniref:LAGLIDADG homing endonuclease n=1 Tax=Henosepilachna vigintioctopunctata TaxID=420089 RepID=A0AAW1V0K4_9CUCU
MSDLSCVFCKETTNEKVKIFTEGTLKKCKEVAEYRSKKQRVNRKSIYSEIELPRGIDTDIVYYSACYKNFTAVRIPKDSNIYTDFRISGPQQVRPSDFAKELKNIKFKDALVKFIINNWSEQDMAHIIANKIININHDMCYEYSLKDGFSLFS